MQVDYFAAQACTNCLWALAVLQGTALPAFDVLVEKLTGSRGWSSLQDVQQQQLFQVLLGGPSRDMLSHLLKIGSGLHHLSVN